MLRLLKMVVFLLCLVISSTVFAATPRGIVTGDNAGSFMIVRDGEIFTCQKGEILYEKDMIKGDNVASLVVEWHPYAKPQLLSNNELVVDFESPGIIDITMNKMKEFLGFVDSEAAVQYGATRGGETQESDEELYPLPGFKANAVEGEPIVFAWGDLRGKTLIIKDNKNKVIFSKDVSGQKSVELAIGETGMITGENYTWQVEGLDDQHKISLLNPATTEKIHFNLKCIDDSVANEGERLLYKASYYQLVSDISSGKIDLYWRSYCMLEKLKLSGNNLQQGKVERLKNNVIEHIGSTY